MIQVAMFTHTNKELDIVFEENDLTITSITDGDTVISQDFKPMIECILDIDTKKLEANQWYYFELKRRYEDDGSGCKKICYFECVKTELIP